MQKLKYAEINGQNNILKQGPNMPFEQGNNVGPGRPKGSKNKVTLAVQTMMADQFPDWDPVIAMAEIAQNDELELAVRIQCMREVAAYMYPKQRSVSVESEPDSGSFSLTWGKPYNSGSSNSRN